MGAGINMPQWVVAITTLFIILAAVIFHYEILSLMNRWVYRRVRKAAWGHRPRYTLLIIMFGLLIAHVFEIWLFATGFWVLSRSDAFGSVVGYDQFTFLDYVYFSVTNYTTVGWGDLHAVGPVRFLAGTESLAGLMLITWSASFTYLIMSRTWKTPGEE